MGSGYRIARARRHDVAALAAIELAAAAQLRGHAPAAVLAESTDPEDFHAARRKGRLWVAVIDDVPVGFALVEHLDDGSAHLEEVDVHPRVGRRGIGTALVRAACAGAAAAGHAAITLTTFRAVPWNMPFYARLGFVEVPEAEWSPSLGAVVREEAARGLDPAARVVMRLALRAG
ncbi:MAG: GNAT family N-acetyltransferase [Candidatus Binatia bacterium]